MKKARRFISTFMAFCMLLGIFGTVAVAENSLPYVWYMGEVFDFENYQIPKVTVSVLDAGGRPVQQEVLMGEGENAVITFEDLEMETRNGFYDFKLQAGTYTFVFKASGFKETSIVCHYPEFHDPKDNIIVPTVRMDPTAEKLAELQGNQPQIVVDNNQGGTSSNESSQQQGSSQGSQGSSTQGGASITNPDEPVITPPAGNNDFSFTKQSDASTLEGKITTEKPPIDVPAVTNVTAELTEANSYYIKWDVLEDVAHYILTLANLSDANGAPAAEVLRKEVTGTTYTVPVTELTLGKQYLVSVTAVKMHSGAPVASEFSGTTMISYGTDAPVVVQPTATEPTDPTEATNATAPTESTDPSAPTEPSLPMGIQTLAMTFADTVAEGVTIEGVDHKTGDIAQNVVINWLHTGTATPVKYVVYLTGINGQVTEYDVTTGTSYSLQRSIGNYSVQVEAHYENDTPAPKKSEAYPFSVRATYTGVTEGWTNKANAVAYVNPVSGANPGATLPENHKLTIVGLTADTNYYQIQYTGITNVAEDLFIHKNDVTLENPTKLTAPTGLNITLGEADAYATMSWTGNDTRADQYEIKVYEENMPSVVDTFYVDKTKTSFVYSVGVKYGTKYAVDICAIKTDNSIEKSAALVGTFKRDVPSGAISAPTVAGDITYKFLVQNDSIVSWSAVTGAGAYEWAIYDKNGERKGWSGAAGITTTSLAASTFAGLTAHETYTLAIRSLPASASSKASVWTYHSFYVVAQTDAFIRSFTVTPSTGVVTPYTQVKFTLNAKVMPSQAYLVLRNTETNVISDPVALTVSSGTVTYEFKTSGKYEVYFFNGANIPVSASQQLTVSSLSIVIFNQEYFSPKSKGTAFQVEWNYVAAATYEIQTYYWDNTLPQKHTVTTHPATVPATAIPQIGRYKMYITMSLDGAMTDTELSFDVVDSTYKEWTGTVKANNTNTYMTPGTTMPSMLTPLSKDAKVTVIGELNSYYHINLGSIGTSAVRVFVAKSALSGTNTNDSGSSGGSSSGGSGSGTGSGGSGGSGSGGSGARATGSISTTAYKDALGSAALRQSSFEYVQDLYKPLIEAMDKGEVMRKTELELLSMSFSPLPDELNSAQYDTVRERAAWDLVTAYLTFLATDAATTEVIAAQDGSKQIANALAAKIQEIKAQDKVLDEAVTKVLDQVLASINTTAQAAATPLSGTPAQAADTVIKTILNTLPYDEQILAAVHKAFELDKDGQPVPADEPTEVRLMRVLYALTVYEHDLLTAALTALPASTTIAEINAVQDVYLDFVFAVSKLHQQAYAFGGATADVVVQNYGAEIARLIAVNKVYNTYAQ